jgi:hypothetical protein
MQIMKLTKQLLKQLIKEQLTNVLREGGTVSPYAAGADPDLGPVAGTIEANECGYDKEGNRSRGVGKYNADGTLCRGRDQAAAQWRNCMRNCIKTGANGTFRGSKEQLQRHCADNAGCEEPEHLKLVTQRGFTSKAGDPGRTERRLPKGVTSMPCKKKGELMQRGPESDPDSFECKRMRGKLVWVKLLGSQHDWGTPGVQESQYSSFPEQQKLHENWNKYLETNKELL